MTLAERYQLFILDLDGVLYRGNEPIAGAVQAVLKLQSLGKPVFYLTNNSGLTREQYVERLHKMNIPAEASQFITSAWATTRYLLSQYGKVKVFVVGEPGLQLELQNAGILIVENPDEQHVDCVIVGIDRSFSYERLRQAQWAILGGAAFIATNCDSTYPAENDRVLPGAGTIVAAIQTATGVKPFTVGKPNTWMLDLLLRQSGHSAQDALLVGDRLDTDIVIAKRAGVPCALVLTGISTRNDLEIAPPEQQPDWVLSNLMAIVESRK
jgi:4-nitrophenyl phosphatase